jgi:Carboxypeptidase regulatory-like domain
VCFLAGASRSSLAQSGATLHGSVILASGAAVAQATVTVEGSAGGQAASTNGSGRYSMSGLNPGSYSVIVTAPGYEKFEVTVNLTEGSDKEIDAVLMALPPEPTPGTPVEPNVTTTPAATTTPPANQPAAEAPQSQPETPQVSSQGGGAAISGIVSDQSGAVITGASVTLKGPAGTRTTTSGANGHYVVSGLPPGTYKLTVTAPNFAPFDTDITLAGGQSMDLPAGLLPASSVENVNVTAGGAAQVETGASNIEGTITEKEVISTGLNGRNFTQLIALAPGVSNQTGQDEAKVGVAGSVKYSVNGGRVEYNNFDVDGSDVLNAGLNGAESTLMVYPSLDAIKEVKVLTSNYGAQYGRTASGTVLVTTKSGTEQFHGGAYDFVRNEMFNARNYFDPPGKAPLYRRQDFGFTLGGPLFIPGFLNSQKKKLFFFWSEEFRLEKSPLGPGNEPGDFNQAVPTLAERGGDFSDVCPFVFPGQTATFYRAQYPDCPARVSAGVGQYSTFFGNQVGNTSSSSNMPGLDPNSVALLNALIPAPNASFGCNSTLAGQTNVQTAQLFMPCYVAAISPPTYWREELGRVDYNITDRVQASFRYIHDAWDTTTTVPQWGYLQTAAVHSQNFPSVENRFNGPGVSLVARLTANSSTLVNEFVASYVNSDITLKDVSGPVGDLSITVPRNNANGIGYIFNNGFGGKLPGIVIGGTNGVYGGNGFAVDTSYMPWEHTNPTYSLADNVSKAIKTHTLQFGVQAVDAQRGETNGAIGAATGDIQGLLSFTNQSGNGTGNSFADFLGQVRSDAPNVSSFQQDSSQLKYYNDYWILEPYVQDDWRVTHRLTLNLGVRFSVFTNYHEKNLNAFNWELSQFNQSVAAEVAIAPVGADGHGGGNILYQGAPVTLPLGANSPVTNGIVQCGKNGIPDSCMSSHLFNPSPRVGFAWDPTGDSKTSIRGGYGLFYEHGTAKEANTGSLEGSPPLNLTMTEPNPEQGYIGIGGGVAYPIDVTSIPTKQVWTNVQQWSLSVQRELPKDMVGTIAYVGSKGTHLSAELQLNQLTAPPTGPDNGIFPSGNPFGPGQPITAQICQGYSGSATGSGYSLGDFTVGDVVVTPKQPAWPNLAAACYILNPSNLPTPNSLRTYAPGIQRVLSLQNVADSQYHALQTTLRRTRGPLTLGVSYTYSHSLDDSSDRSDPPFVNSSDIQANWANSNFDQRHLLSVNYIYAFPKLSGMVDRWTFHNTQSSDPADPAKPLPAQSGSRFLRVMLDGWEYSGITTFQSGTPFSIINGGGNTGVSVTDNAGVANGSGSGSGSYGSYADLIGNPRSALPAPVNNAASVGPLLYNPAAFAAPQGLTFGDVRRNSITNPHRLNFDMNLLKNFKISERSSLEFRAEAFNIFNHTQFRIFNPNIGNTGSNVIGCYGGPDNSAFGGLTPLPNSPPGTPPVEVDCTTGSAFLRPVDSHRPRTIQFGLKYSF